MVSRFDLEDNRNKNLPKLPIYDFKDGRFVVRISEDNKKNFICLAPQRDNEWERSFNKYFGINKNRQYYNPLCAFFVDGYLNNIGNFRADSVFSSQICKANSNSGAMNTQAWKGSDVCEYEDADIGEQHQFNINLNANDNKNRFMQSIALYKPYLCNDKHLHDIIAAALKFYKEGWRWDNSASNIKHPCNVPKKDYYINLKHVAYLLFFAIEVRRLPDTPGGQLKGYNEIEKVKLSDFTLHLVEEAVKKKIKEVLNHEGNNNHLSIEQIGDKFRKINELENTIKAKQTEYRNKLYEIIEQGLSNYSDFQKSDKDRYKSFTSIMDGKKYLQKIQECELEKIIHEFEEEDPSKSCFGYYCLGYYSIQQLLTDEQKKELNNISTEVKDAERCKERLCKEIGTEDFHNQIKELDEMRRYLTFFRNHSECNLSLLGSIINWLCSFFGRKPFNDDRKFNVEKNPFDLINGATSEQEPIMESPDNIQNNILT